MIRPVGDAPLAEDAIVAVVAPAADRVDLGGMGRAVAPVISPPLIDSSCAHR